MQELTARQREVYQAVLELCVKGGGTTFHEVRARVGLAGMQPIVRHIEILEKRGFLVPRERGKRRGIFPAKRPKVAA